jgi:hypothetical protein
MQVNFRDLTPSVEITIKEFLMKKIVIGVMLLLSVSLCFAKGQKDMYEIGIGYHSLTESQKINGVEVRTTVPSFAINFAGISFFTETIGIGAYGNILSPQELRMTASGETITVNRSAYNSLSALDFLIGPVFMLYKNETFSLPLAAGLHWYFLSATTNTTSATSFKLGLGANITGEYHFNPNFFAYARFHFLYDFFELGADGITSWGIGPCIGIGFQR